MNNTKIEVLNIDCEKILDSFILGTKHNINTSLEINKEAYIELDKFCRRISKDIDESLKDNFFIEDVDYNEQKSCCLDLNKNKIPMVISTFTNLSDKAENHFSFILCARKDTDLIATWKVSEHGKDGY